MKKDKEYARWILQHALAIIVSYIIGSIVLLLIHGWFGFSMNDDGTYLSNTIMHIGCGVILALGTGVLQRKLIKEYFKVSFAWVWSLVTGFVIAESLAGIVLWKLEIFRGLINVFNSTNHFPEAVIFALSGLISGLIQSRLLKPYFRKTFYWIAANTLGWGLFILSAYFLLFAIILGPVLYGAFTGFVFYRVLESKKPV